ncbi:hypothetical protein BDV95DRAFT_608608 [Massariosphaeria phaeospora]|uniref:Uncharacterized protein n=1 Tax=Massariosphaeria phaeospora TaxID=100035 RepID=A0A7C8M6C0_9PLEO|nr:hypothetical protein BDV95DRAFT_608608 [Massariosphaeria phaeospora]
MHPGLPNHSPPIPPETNGYRYRRCEAVGRRDALEHGHRVWPTPTQPKREPMAIDLDGIEEGHVKQEHQVERRHPVKSEHPAIDPVKSEGQHDIESGPDHFAIEDSSPEPESSSQNTIIPAIRPQRPQKTIVPALRPRGDTTTTIRRTAVPAIRPGLTIPAIFRRQSDQLAGSKRIRSLEQDEEDEFIQSPRRNKMRRIHDDDELDGEPEDEPDDVEHQLQKTTKPKSDRSYD